MAPRLLSSDLPELNRFEFLLMLMSISLLIGGLYHSTDSIHLSSAYRRLWGAHQVSPERLEEEGENGNVPNEQDVDNTEDPVYGLVASGSYDPDPDTVNVSTLDAGGYHTFASLTGEGYSEAERVQLRDELGQGGTQGSIGTTMKDQSIASSSDAREFEAQRVQRRSEPFMDIFQDARESLSPPAGQWKGSPSDSERTIRPTTSYGLAAGQLPPSYTSRFPTTDGEMGFEAELASRGGAPLPDVFDDEDGDEHRGHLPSEEHQGANLVDHQCAFRYFSGRVEEEFAQSVRDNGVPTALGTLPATSSGNPAPGPTGQVASSETSQPSSSNNSAHGEESQPRRLRQNSPEHDPGSTQGSYSTSQRPSSVNIPTQVGSRAVMNNPDRRKSHGDAWPGAARAA